MIITEIMTTVMKGSRLAGVFLDLPRERFANLNLSRVICVVFLLDKIRVSAGLERRRFPWVGPSADP
jgi:hypothetical protein